MLFFQMIHPVEMFNANHHKKTFKMLRNVDVAKMRTREVILCHLTVL